MDTGQQWAEVNFVPNWIGRNSPEYRFLGVREPFRNPPLPGMESEAGLSPHVMETKDGGWFKVFGIVTNRVDGEELIWWSRAVRQGGGGARGAEGRPGRRAAAVGIVRRTPPGPALAFNLRDEAVGAWVSRRLKAVRFGFISLPGRVVRHAGKDNQPRSPFIPAVVPGATANPGLGPRAAGGLSSPSYHRCRPTHESGPTRFQQVAAPCANLNCPANLPRLPHPQGDHQPPPESGPYPHQPPPSKRPSHPECPLPITYGGSGLTL